MVCLMFVLRSVLHLGFLNYLPLRKPVKICRTVLAIAALLGSTSLPWHPSLIRKEIGPLSLEVLDEARVVVAVTVSDSLVQPMDPA